MSDNSAKIRELNDAFRRNGPTTRRWMMTRGVRDSNHSGLLIRAVATFNDFTEGNDPHGEHDFGAIVIDGTKYFWKIDYYDASMEYGSEDPSDPTQTTRVLTIMLASEY